jgi:hypothetical protein
MSFRVSLSYQFSWFSDYLTDLARHVDILKDPDCIKFFRFDGMPCSYNHIFLDRTVNLLVDLQNMKSSRSLYKAMQEDDLTTSFRSI